MPSGVLLPNAKLPIATSPNAIWAVDARSPARLLQFDLDGHLAATLDLAAHYDEIHTVMGKGDRVFLDMTGSRFQDDRVCTYALVEWTLRP